MRKRPGLAGIPQFKSEAAALRASHAVDDDPTLFPTVAISDAVNAIAHAVAAWLVLPASYIASLGFVLVAAAAAFGTGRFGFSVRLFRPGHDSLVELSAFAGLPLVGYAAAQFILSEQTLKLIDPTVLVVLLAALGGVARGLPKAAVDGVRAVVVALTFIIPVVAAGVIRRDALLVRAWKEQSGSHCHRQTRMHLHRNRPAAASSLPSPALLWARSATRASWASAAWTSSTCLSAPRLSASRRVCAHRIGVGVEGR